MESLKDSMEMKTIKRKYERDFIQFFLNGKLYKIKNICPDTTLLEWLRETIALTGTKEGCAEGDCGSCTVVIAQTNTNGDIFWKAINSCIAFLPMLDGTSITTIENVTYEDGELHPCQSNMVANFGSQCGFCTPGIIMSTYAGWCQNIKWSAKNVERMLAGNLCRCTGYASIKRSCKNLSLYKRKEIDAKRKEKELEHINTLNLTDSLDMKTKKCRWYAPKSLRELTTHLNDFPMATIISGSTDVGLWVTKKRKHIPHFISLQKIDALKTISESKFHWEIGAGVTLAAFKEEVGKFNPDFDEVLSRFGSEQVRSQGTIGGNIANASPIGDLPPMLLALNASITLQSKGGVRSIQLKDFFIRYGIQNRYPNEVLVSIKIPKLNKYSIFRAYKVSKRFDQDISCVMAAFYIEIKNNIVADIRLGFGGMAEIPKRATCVEKFLRKKSFTQANIVKASAKFLMDFSPISDLRGSKEYRETSAKNLLTKWWLEIENSQYYRLSCDFSENQITRVIK